MYKVIAAFTKALDLSDIRIVDHSHRVAYIVLKLGERLGLDQQTIQEAVLAAFLHDIGISSSQWRLESHHLYPAEELVQSHCRLGADLVSQVSFLKHLAPTIISHHDRWSGPNPSKFSGEDIPLAARLIHLADRIEIQIKPEPYILEQVPEIVNRIDQLNQFFWPNAIDAFKELRECEAFWFDLVTANHQGEIAKSLPAEEELPFPALQEIAELFATVIDLKSPFTAKHSRGVAATASWLATLVGMSPTEVAEMEVAGLLHDLGKLAVPDQILEYPGSLSPDQFRLMKQHTYYTYHLLSCLPQYPHLKEWAAFHHEKLDGSGYPFRIPGEKLSLGARIMAVADIFQALSEDRPYRPGLSLTETRQILDKSVASGKIDADLTRLLIADPPNHLIKTG